MIYCKYCRNKKGCVYAGEDCTREECIDHIPTTNADRIREMPVEELAAFIEGAVCPPHCYTKRIDECQKDDCVPCWLAWLKEEVSDG